MDRMLLKAIDIPGWMFELTPGLNRIGRNPTNDFRVPDASVSSFHCEIVVADNTVQVRDLGSTNGTFIDGQSTQQAELKPGHMLQLGTVRMVVEQIGAEGPIVRIPTFVKAEPATPVPTVLSDGSLACANHRTTLAAFKCMHCQQGFCRQCVRSLAVPGGKEMQFCPLCSGRCESLANAPAVENAMATAPEGNQKSLLGRLTQTLRIPFKRH